MTEPNDDDIVYDNDTADTPAVSAPQAAPTASPFGDDGMLKKEFVPTPKPAAPADDRFDATGMLKPAFVPKPKDQPTV